MSRPPPAYPDFVSTSSFSENKPPPAYVEDETDEPRVHNLDPQALQAALRVEMARRKRLERELQREREAAQRDTSPGHLNHVIVIRAPRREQPRTVGVLALGSHPPMPEPNYARGKMTRRVRLCWLFIILLCIIMLVVPIFLIAKTDS